MVNGRKEEVNYELLIINDELLGMQGMINSEAVHKHSFRGWGNKSLSTPYQVPINSVSITVIPRHTYDSGSTRSRRMQGRKEEITKIEEF